MLFGKHKLMREGARAEAVVTAARQYGGHTAGASEAAGRTLPVGYHVTLRVRFDDGSTVEVARKADLYGRVTEGDILPVRYDPEDHSKIEVDEPALRAQSDAADAERAQAKQARVSDRERQLAPGAAPPAAASDPVERLEKLADLRDRGVLTDAEFAAQKATILSEG